MKTYMHGVLENLPEETQPGQTPQTDEEERWAEWGGQEFKCVDSSFARELEIQRNALLSELKRAHKELCDLGNPDRPFLVGMQDLIERVELSK